MSRFFAKISYDTFKRDVKDDLELYESISLPRRSTNSSAGYDIRSIEDGIIRPGEAKTFKTGIKVCMEVDEVLCIYIRSSLAYKYNVCLMNNVGIIDADYYNNIDNEGHIQIRLVNLGNSDFEVKIGDRIAQGIFTKYLTVDNEDIIDSKRNGGLGSTGK